MRKFTSQIWVGGRGWEGDWSTEEDRQNKLHGKGTTHIQQHKTLQTILVLQKWIRGLGVGTLSPLFVVKRRFF